jgi:hypothetical protein
MPSKQGQKTQLDPHALAGIAVERIDHLGIGCRPKRRKIVYHFSRLAEHVNREAEHLRENTRWQPVR